MLVRWLYLARFSDSINEYCGQIPSVSMPTDRLPQSSDRLRVHSRQVGNGFGQFTLRATQLTEQRTSLSRKSVTVVLPSISEYAFRMPLVLIIRYVLSAANATPFTCIALN